jgi:hypothetical protein
MMGQNPMKIMWNHEKVSVHKTLHWMITATLKWTQLTIVFNGKNKMKQGMVWSSTHIRGKWQNILTDYLRLLAKQGMPLCPSKHEIVSLQVEFQISLFSTQISIFLLSILTSAAKVMPNWRTQLRWKLSSVSCDQLECFGVTKQVWKNCRVLTKVAMKNFAWWWIRDATSS